MQSPGEGIKVGWHGVGPVTDPDAAHLHGGAGRSSRHCGGTCVSGCPEPDPDTATEISCTYTTTPDTNFVLKRLGPITVGAGFSGHGFRRFDTRRSAAILADRSEEGMF